MNHTYSNYSNSRAAPGYGQLEPIPMLDTKGASSFQPIPMLPQTKPPSNMYNNPQRNGAPNSYGYPPKDDYYRGSLSARSTQPLVPHSKTDRNGINDPYRRHPLYDQDNTQSDGFAPNQRSYENEPQSWWSKPFCCGLSRLAGGILLATMTILGLGALAGLIVCVVLYVNDNVTDFQWKILGIVVCSVLLITIIITFFIFICCYQSGHIADNTFANGPRNLQSQRMSNYNDRPSVLRNGNTYNSPAYASKTNATPIPTYNPTSMRTNDRFNYPENINTPFRPRNLQNGNGLPVNNALGTVAYNPPINNNGQSLAPYQSNGVTNNNPNFVPYQELGLGNNYANGYPNQSYVPTNLGQVGIPYQMNPQTRLATQGVQRLPQDYDGFSNQANAFPNSNIARRFVPPRGTRIEYIDDERRPRIIEKRTRRFIEHPEYDIVEEIIERPKPKLVREYVEVVEDSAKPSHIAIQRNGQIRHQNIPINSTRIIDSPPEPIFDDLSTDRFYK